MHPSRTLRSYKAHGEQPNITGFDMRAFKAATGTPRYDPWERHEAWRFQGPFTRWNRFRRGLPGLGIASVAFAAYCGYEYLFLNDEHAATGHRGGEEAHH